MAGKNKYRIYYRSCDGKRIDMIAIEASTKRAAIKKIRKNYSDIDIVKIVNETILKK